LEQNPNHSTCLGKEVIHQDNKETIMNLELVLRQDLLSPAPVREINRSFVNKKKIGNTVSIPAIPSLEEMLKQIGRLPKDCLFFGYAEDDLPVLLNLRNLEPGPILISGDAGAGKTDLLKVITQYATLKYDPQEIQLGVITDHPQEWQDQLDCPHCVGLFPMREKGTVKFIQALEAWISYARRNAESVLLMIDGLGDFAHLYGGLTHEMNEVLVHGPARKIRTIATFNPRQQPDAHTWLKYFHTQIFGYTKNSTLANDPGLPEATIRSLASGCEFILKESGKWIKFRIPKV
jgi:hypothetical protein